MRIRFVDGHKIRNTITPDFAVTACHEYSPFVPKGELWFDKNYRKELEFMMKIHRLYQKMPGGLSYFRQRTYICNRMIQKVRRIPLFKIRTNVSNGIKVVYVRGEIIRKYLDPEFILGGHGYVYPYIPKNQIWIDAVMGKKEYRYTLIHELHERKLMKKGTDYDNAHDYALVAEKQARRKDGARYFGD
ncbi:hypothetical protein HYX14_02890 [Candidatus Woesearchaeota archaeon]|nr:hypothetical protein [Candidatus Woesearchaeota archaeon]